MEKPIDNAGHPDIIVEQDFQGGIELGGLIFIRALFAAARDGKLSGELVREIATEAGQYLDSVIQKYAESADAD